MSDSLEQVFPQEVELQIHGETLKVLPLKMRQLPKVSSCMTRLFKYVNQDEMDIAGLLAEGSQDLVNAVAVAVDKPVEWIEDLGLDEMVILSRTVIEVNSDFFYRRVMPELSKGQEIIKHLAGSISSKS